MLPRPRIPRVIRTGVRPRHRALLRRTGPLALVLVGLSYLLPAGAQSLAAPLSVGPNPVRAGQTVSVVSAISRATLNCDAVEIMTTAILPRGDETITSFGPGGFGLAGGRFVPFPVATFDSTGLLRATFPLSPTLLPGNYPVTVGRGCGGNPSSLFVSTSFAVLSATTAPSGPGSPSLFVPFSPFRLFDTRSGSGGVAATKVVGNTMFDLQITGRGTPAIPADATAVVLNLTYVDAEGAGFVTAWPSGEDFPGVSNLNKIGPGPSPNQATVKIGTGGRISIFNQGSATHLLGDVAGYFVPATTFGTVTVPTTPTTVASSTTVGTPNTIATPTSAVLAASSAGTSGPDVDDASTTTTTIAVTTTATTGRGPSGTVRTVGS